MPTTARAAKPRRVRTCTPRTMPKGGKKKKQDDNWEDEADAIYELEKSKDAAAAKESKIDALFAEAIAKGKLTEAEQDRF